MASGQQSSSDQHGEAFAFGKNWSRFLANLSEERMAAAEDSLRRLLQRDHLGGVRVLDAGSGSGLFSLAAYRLGAAVTSFDVDPDSLACTAELQRRFGLPGDRWQVLHGSLLDPGFLETLGHFQVVYCWGVAHHTGNMWAAIAHLASLVEPGGQLVLAIYNDQQYVSRAWRAVKRIYQRLPRWIRPAYVAMIGCGLFAKRLAVTLVACSLRLVSGRNPVGPLTTWASETHGRGMHGWYDLVDWVGGWPFEVARPEEVFRFLRDRKFVLQELTTSPGHGCNEFVFQRDAATSG